MLRERLTLALVYEAFTFAICRSAIIGKELQCTREVGNARDRYAISLS